MYAPAVYCAALVVLKLDRRAFDCRPDFRAPQHASVHPDPCKHAHALASCVLHSCAGEQPSLTPRKVTILNTATQSFIQDLSFPSSVLAVRMNRKRCGWHAARLLSSASCADWCQAILLQLVHSKADAVAVLGRQTAAACHINTTKRISTDGMVVSRLLGVSALCWSAALTKLETRGSHQHM